MERSKLLYDTEGWEISSSEAIDIFETFISSAEELDYYLDFYENSLEQSENVKRAVENLRESYDASEEALEQVNEVITDLGMRSVHLHPYFPDRRAVEEFEDHFGKHPEGIKEEDPDELYHMVKQTEEQNLWQTKRTEKEINTLSGLFGRTEQQNRSRLTINENQSAINPLFNKYQDLERSYRTVKQRAFEVINENKEELREQYGLDLMDLFELPDDIQSQMEQDLEEIKDMVPDNSEIE